MSISLQSGARELEIFLTLQNNNVKNGKVGPVWGSTLQKIRVASKNALNKSCSKSNFVQKSLRAQCLSPPEWS